jgi:hypothetical protein
MTYTVTLEGALEIVFPDPSMKDIEMPSNQNSKGNNNQVAYHDMIRL